MDKDCYEILGVRPDAKPDEIKAAFRAQALRRHPDLNAGDPRAGERFMRLQAAYEVLGNPQRRARYDLGRSRRVPDPGSRPAAAAPARAAPRRGLGPAILMFVGALVALRGFAGLFLGPQDAMILERLTPGIGPSDGFRLFVIGLAMVLCAAGFRRL